MTTESVPVAVTREWPAETWPMFAAVGTVLDPRQWGVTVLTVRNKHVRDRHEQLALAGGVAASALQTLGYERALLFALHSALQPATRISRYYRLWKRLEKSGRIPTGPRLDDEVQSGVNGVRYAGTVLFPLDELPAALEFSRQREGVVILADDVDRRASQISTLFDWTDPDKSGVRGGIGGRFILRCLAERMIVLRASGQFDDPTLNVDLFGRNEQTNSFYDAVWEHLRQAGMAG